MAKTEKQCPNCGKTKPIRCFVTVYGFENSRGKYCRECFLSRQQQEVMTLMDGRDFCLYCGTKIKKARDYSIDGKPLKTYVHCDHMDPIQLGGFDPYTVDSDGELPDEVNRNLVFCCATCNMRKSDKPFVEWLKELAPKFQAIARDVYFQKNGRQPGEAEIEFPTAFQKKLCKRLNVVINPNMTRTQIDAWLEKARTSPKFMYKFRRIEIEDEANRREYEKQEQAELRNDFGDELVNEFNRWQKICDSDEPHILVFRQGQRIVVDVVEFEEAEIEDAKKPFLKLYCLFPKKLKEFDDELFWEKEKTVRASKVLHCEKIKEETEKLDGGLLYRVGLCDAKHYEEFVAEFAKRTAKSS